VYRRVLESTILLPPTVDKVKILLLTLAVLNPFNIILTLSKVLDVVICAANIQILLNIIQSILFIVTPTSGFMLLYST
jgi:hypothetical protein